MNIDYTVEKDVAEDGSVTFITKATGVDGREFTEPLFTRQFFTKTFIDGAINFETNAERAAVSAMERAIEAAGEDAFK